MAGPGFGKRTALILPLVLLVVALVEDAITYKVRQHVPGLHERVAILVVLKGAAFAVAASWLTPLVKQLLTSARKGSRVGAGTLGLLAFYVLAYGGVYWAYLVVEQRGIVTLLPRVLR